jgi:hypothetical protein
MSAALVLTVNATTFDKKSSEVAYLARVLEIAAAELSRGQGAVTSGSIIGTGQGQGGAVSLGAWAYSPTAGGQAMSATAALLGVRPSVRLGFRFLRGELGFTAWPDDQLLAVLEDLVPLAMARSPSTGKPGRAARHGRYCKSRAADGERL